MAGQPDATPERPHVGSPLLRAVVEAYDGGARADLLAVGSARELADKIKSCDDLLFRFLMLELKGVGLTSAIKRVATALDELDGVRKALRSLEPQTWTPSADEIRFRANPAQVEALQRYGSGDYVDLIRVRTRDAVEARLRTVGDSLLEFVFRELDDRAGCRSVEDAMARVREAIGKVEDVQSALLRLDTDLAAAPIVAEQTRGGDVPFVPNAFQRTCAETYDHGAFAGVVVAATKAEFEQRLDACDDLFKFLMVQLGSREVVGAGEALDRMRTAIEDIEGVADAIRAMPAVPGGGR